jgi:hypothetical protein
MQRLLRRLKALLISKCQASPTPKQSKNNGEETDIYPPHLDMAKHMNLLKDITPSRMHKVSKLKGGKASIQPTPSRMHKVSKLKGSKAST